MQGYIFVPECTDKYERAGKKLAAANGIFDSLFIDYPNIVDDLEALPSSNKSGTTKCIFVGGSWKEGDEVCSWTEAQASLVTVGGWTEDDFIIEEALKESKPAKTE